MVGDAPCACFSRFVLEDRARRNLVASPEPLERAVTVHADTWRPWMDGRKALRTPWSDTAVAAIEELPTAGPWDGRHDRRTVDRARLLAQSTFSAVERTDESRVRLLVTTLLWGSGTSNGRGPRYAARALRDDRLAPALATTAELVLRGRLSAAYERFRVRGIGPSFFTKWFWAVGLAAGSSPAPLILDRRVADCMRRLTAEAWQTTGQVAARRYEEFVERMESWAHSLASDLNIPAIAAEKLEYLLFDRGPGCLHDWLLQRASA